MPPAHTATDRLEEKLDALTADVGEVKLNLREHMRRTELAEVAVARLQDSVVPLQTHVAMWAGAWKVLAVLSTAGGVAAWLRR